MFNTFMEMNLEEFVKIIATEISNKSPSKEETLAKKPR
jgi:hypothetical protein